MNKNIKKVMFGGYQKKATEETLTTLASELAAAQKELAELRQQTDRQQFELNEKQAEAEKQARLSAELLQKTEVQQSEIKKLNALLEESLKTTAEYNNNITRIGEVYALAYDSAYRMAEDAQNSAEEFVGVICDNVVEAQNELSKLKFAAIEIKSSIAQRLEQLRRQFLSLQEHLLAVADEELVLADTINDLNQLKDNTIRKIGDELKQYSLKNKSFHSTMKFAPTPLENLLNQRHAVQKTGVVSDFPCDKDVPAASHDDSTQEEKMPEDLIPEAPEPEVEKTVTVPAEEIKPAETPFPEVVNPAQVQAPEPAVSVSQPEKSVPPSQPQSGEPTTNKQKSVKDILKKYGNL